MSDLFDKKALTYRSREKIKCAKYQKGMMDNLPGQFTGQFTRLQSNFNTTSKYTYNAQTMY